MSHFRHLNDSTEMLYGRRLTNELMDAEVQQKDQTSDFFDYCKFVLNYHDDNAIQYFVSSFSVLLDSAKLWNRYGDKGDGVAIVFDAKRMGSDPGGQLGFHIARVAYTVCEQTDLLLPLITAAKTVLVPYVERFGYDVRDVAIQMLAAKLCSHLNHHSISLKDETWSIEREWRTVFSLMGNEQEEQKARVAVRSDGRPYVDVPVRSADPYELRMPILKVTAGCSADTQLIRATLDAFGYQNVVVEGSVFTSDLLSRVAGR